MKRKIFFLLFLSAALQLSNVSAQIPNCDSLVPVFNIDFTAAISDSTWISPTVSRSGNCCSTAPPDLCIHFEITTGVNTIAIVFGMPGCPLPNGSIMYQIDCGTPVHYTDTTFISVPGVYHLTYCKPGNFPCSYSITSLTPSSPTAITEKNETTCASLIIDYSGNYFLNLDLISPQSFTLNIFSAEGRIVSENYYELAAGHHTVPLPAQDLARGVYFCRVVTEGIEKSLKFIK